MYNKHTLKFKYADSCHHGMVRPRVANGEGLHIVIALIPSRLIGHASLLSSKVHGPWCRIFEKLIVTQLVKKYPAFFMEPEGSLLCSQNTAI
jgi:hypothetical protein